MKDSEKNRDPKRAQKRAVGDARCALRKLGLLDELERVAETRDASSEDLYRVATERAAFVERLALALGIGGAS